MLRAWEKFSSLLIFRMRARWSFSFALLTSADGKVLPIPANKATVCSNIGSQYGNSGIFINSSNSYMIQNPVNRMLPYSQCPYVSTDRSPGPLNNRYVTPIREKNHRKIKCQRLALNHPLIQLARSQRVSHADADWTQSSQRSHNIRQSSINHHFPNSALACSNNYHKLICRLLRRNSSS